MHTMFPQQELLPSQSHRIAQEAYEGPESSCDVTGLAPGSQLVFCVKVRGCGRG